MQILSPKEMQKIDKDAIKSGISGYNLMENAGRSVAKEIVSKFRKTKVLVLCGPGNNGGDGFVVARILSEIGWEVSVASVNISKLKGDAEKARLSYKHNISSIISKDIDVILNKRRIQKDKNKSVNSSCRDTIKTNDLLIGKQIPQHSKIAPNLLVIDAIFGTGLNKIIKGDLAEVIEKINKSNALVVAVDIPSGINGENGEVMGVAIKADITLTFTRKKLGLVLMPGKMNAGEVITTDIGIPEEIINKQKFSIYENSPNLWISSFPFPEPQDNKYTRGHVVVASGGVDCTGAACLASISALRCGAGLVTVLSPKEALSIYASKLNSVMAKPFRNIKEFVQFISDKHKNVIVLGPGNGANEETAEKVKKALSLKKTCVIDADAISAFAGRGRSLFKMIKSPVVLTPHEGEFARIFDIKGDKIKRAKDAAKKSNADIVLKCTDTIIEAHDNRIVINTCATPNLATAGTGDVLSGIIAGLLAQRMDPFEAACAGVYLHSQAAKEFGIGLIAEDMPQILPAVLNGLKISNL